MLHNTNSAVFQHCSKGPFLKGFAKFALRSVATIIDKIRRISVETMSNIPENLDNSTHEESFFVNFMSISFQFYAKRPFRICNFFLNMGLTPLPPPFQQCPKELLMASLIEFPPKFHLKAQKRPIPKDPLKTASQNH